MSQLLHKRQVLAIHQTCLRTCGLASTGPRVSRGSLTIFQVMGLESSTPENPKLGSGGLEFQMAYSAFLNP